MKTIVMFRNWALRKKNIKFAYNQLEETSQTTIGANELSEINNSKLKTYKTKYVSTKKKLKQAQQIIEQLNNEKIALSNQVSDLRKKEHSEVLKKLKVESLIDLFWLLVNILLLTSLSILIDKKINSLTKNIVLLVLLVVIIISYIIRILFRIIIYILIKKI